MNLYKIWRDEDINWDTYDSAVVAAESVDDAKTIHPDGETPPEKWMDPYSTWTPTPENVKVEFLGPTELPRGVIVASFNAG